MRRYLLGIFLLASAVPALCNMATTGDLLVAPVPPPGPPGGIPIPFLLLDAAGVQKTTFGLGHQVVTGGSSIFTTYPLTVYDFSLQQTGTAATLFEPVATSDASGHGYVINPNHIGEVDEYDGSANVVRQITLPGATGDLDLAPDSCTLFWIGAGNLIHRYDICGNVPLTDPAPGVQASFVRALTGGGFLAGKDLNLTFYDANGTPVRTINTGNFVSWAAFTPDGQAIWVASTGNLARYPIGGSVPNLTTNVNAEMVSVVGEQRPTIAQVLAASAPALSPLLLGMLAAVLIAVALTRAG